MPRPTPARPVPPIVFWSHAMSNPLLERYELPPFSAIKPEHVKAAARALISESREFRNRLLADLQHPTWKTLVADRKSTRLNSSHVATTYAVFCHKTKFAHHP